MRSTHVAYLFSVAVLLTSQSCVAFAQDSKGFSVSVKKSGSVPPVTPWFSCVRDIAASKHYQKAEAQDCLTSLLSHPEITKGKFKYRRYKESNVLTFYLESPSLTVTDVNLDLATGVLAKAHEFLAANGNVLTPGRPYDSDKEASSWLVLDLLSRSQGRRAGVSTTVHLDYDKKSARVDFKTWEGPSGEPEPLIPPYAAPCPIMNGNFNWVDVDDLTPVSYIRREMKIKWLGCFSESDLRDDEARLKQMSFLKDSKISVAGSGQSRDFSFYYRSNPIPISKVIVRGYGLLSDLAESDIPPISIHVGDNYSRSRAEEVENSLKSAFAKEGRQLKVFTDVNVSSIGATLNFGVLAYPNDVVYIGAQAFDRSFHDNK